MAVDKLDEHPYLDSDTQRGFELYAENDREVLGPSKLQALGALGLLGDIPRQCGEMLEKTYNNHYPMDVKDDEVLTHKITEGSLHMFALRKEEDESLEAMAAIEEQPNQLGGNVRFAELGRALERPDSTSSSRALLKARVPWATQNLPHLDFLYSVTRTGEAHDGIASGQGVQSVWWGGQRFEGMVPIHTTNCGWEYKVGKIEPFNSFVIPTDREKWLKKASRSTVYVPQEADCSQLNTLLGEASDDLLCDVAKVTEAEQPDKLRFATLSAESPAASGKYVVTEQDHTLPEQTEEEVEARLGNGFSQKVTIETDIAATETCAGIISKLYEQGWTLTGWEPSRIEYGAICPVLGRVNPESLNELAQPELHAKNFDNAGLEGTRQTLDTMYASMIAKAAAKYANHRPTKVLLAAIN